MSFNSFPDKQLIAELSAKMLLEIGAINFRPNDPYILTSGKASPVYIDCRKIISFPRVRSTLMDFGASTIMRDIGFESIDAVAGGETAGIPFAAWLAERLSLPMQYVRKKPKGFGRDAQIEGYLEEGSKVLLVEDLTTDGGSKITFCDALRKAGAEVTDTFVIFFYDIFPDTRQKLGEAGGMFSKSVKKAILWIANLLLK
jgi:orotate phosphoribosyltransferase